MEMKPMENYVKNFSVFFQLHFLLFINASENVVVAVPIIIILTKNDNTSRMIVVWPAWNIFEI